MTMEQVRRLVLDLDNHVAYLSHALRSQVGRDVTVNRWYLARVVRNLKKVYGSRSHIGSEKP